MEISYWTSSGGRAYVKEDIAKLPPDQKKVIILDLRMLANWDFDSAVRVKFIKPLKGDKMRKFKIHEVVIKRFRIFCVFRNSACWLLHMFKKESNNTPQNELDKAYNRALALDLYLQNL